MKMPPPHTHTYARARDEQDNVIKVLYDSSRYDVVKQFPCPLCYPKFVANNQILNT
jgi:hypothetical protein